MKKILYLILGILVFATCEKQDNASKNDVTVTANAKDFTSNSAKLYASTTYKSKTEYELKGGFVYSTERESVDSIVNFFSTFGRGYFIWHNQLEYNVIENGNIHHYLVATNHLCSLVDVNNFELSVGNLTTNTDYYYTALLLMR